jgi:hypothetical protein
MNRSIILSPVLLVCVGLTWACGGPKDGEDTGPESAGEPASSDADTDSDADSDTDADIELPPGLNGTVISPRLPVPTFSATNRDGTARGASDLIDGPTVMWFYPLAGSYG